ncbi:MAG TPA: hypothetical protein VKZ81_19790 [Pseudonocardia sp.]|jgi:hypothetical protein|uniref:hypothetical protein n=1 Tax=Pseudonocardia sp. TaxID=60912 RepID=UPI002B4B23C3|nr:hypothetical protein [Pseudonocardia sp.]HLU57703.1 hypothetical protein [Pseudonocardia sp.]
MPTTTPTLTARDRALLRAVAAGRCDFTPTRVPDLRVDGRWFCDQARAHALLAAGLLARSGGSPTTATLTGAGRAALDREQERPAA